MEQQKILWIIFSVALFLLVVTVVGFVWFLPSDEAAESPIARTADAETGVADEEYNPIEWAREREAVPDVTEDEEADDDGDLLLVIGEEPEDEVQDADGESTASTAESQSVDGDNDDDGGAQVTVKVVEVPVTEKSPRTSRPATDDAEARTAVTPPASDTRAAVPAKAEPRTVTTTQYWIQAGSFTSRARAEDAETLLAAKGWNARILSRDINDTTYFRVRIGPYGSEAEAEKFLSWLKDIDSFESSYISQVYTTRTVN